MFHGFYSRDNFAARFLQSSTSFPLWTMPIFLLLSEAIAGCHFPDWKFLANCKDRAQEGWVRSHTACSKVWSYSRNCLQSDTPSFFCFGDCLILATQHLVLSVDSDRKEKKRWKSSQKTLVDSGLSQAFSTIFCSGIENWDFPRHLISVPMYHFYR